MTSTAPPPPWWRRALPLVGVASAAFVLSHLDLRALAASLTSLPMGHVALACACMAVNVVGKGARWQRMLVGRGARVPMGFAQVVFAEGAFWGSLTIGRVGELFRAAPLVDRGVPLKPALASCLLDRAFDLAFLVVVGAASYALVVDQPWLAAAVVVAATAATIGAATWSRAAPFAALGGGDGARRDAATAVPRDGPPSVVGDGAVSADAPTTVPTSKLRLVVDEARAFFRPLPLVEAIAWTTASWAASYAVVVVLADALAPTASLPRIVTATSTANLSTLLPITYQGVGAREPIFALLLAPDGVTAERAVALSLATFAVNLATVLAMGGAAVLLRRR